MSDVTGVISLLNILLSKPCSTSSSSAAVRLLVWISSVCLSDSALLERGVRRVFIPVGPLYEHGLVS